MPNCLVWEAGPCPASDASVTLTEKSWCRRRSACPRWRPRCLTQGRQEGKNPGIENPGERTGSAAGLQIGSVGGADDATCQAGGHDGSAGEKPRRPRTCYFETSVTDVAWTLHGHVGRDRCWERCISLQTLSRSSTYRTRLPVQLVPDNVQVTPLLLESLLTVAVKVRVWP